MKAHARTFILFGSLLLTPVFVAGNLQGALQQQQKQPVARKQADSVRAAHILSRLTFGSRPGDLDRVLSMGVDRWIAEQLQPEAINDSVSSALVAAIPDRAASLRQATFVRAVPQRPALRVAIDSTGKIVQLDSTAMKTMVLAQRNQAEVKLLANLVILRGRGGVDPASVARVVRSESSERHLNEVLTDFWLNHFSVFSGKVPAPTAIAAYERDAIRPHSMGKFRDILGAVAKSPAMLFYLDNHLSSADPQRLTLPEFQRSITTGTRSAAGTRPGLNENYARELLELHTLGVDGGYTQNDVIEVARAFTGWTIAGTTTADSRLGTRLVAKDIVVSSAAQQAERNFFFDEKKHDAEEKTVLGRKLAAGRGIEDAEEVLDIVASHPSTARFIARKLATRLVSDDPPATLVDRAAATFTRTGGDIREVVRTIVTSDEFFDESAFRSKIKSPHEFVMAMRRALGVPTDASPASASLILELKQPLWGKETPDGWPETGSSWMNSGAMFNRIAVAMRVVNGEVPTMSPDSSATWRAVAAAPFEQQVDAVVKNVLAGRITPETHALLKAVGSGDGSGNVKPDGKETLRELLLLAFGSPEFQRK